MASSTNDQESPSSSSPSGRVGATALVVLALVLIIGVVVAFLLLRDDGDDATSTETLVVLDGNEMHHIGTDGEITASFDLGLDSDELHHLNLVGSHVVAMLDTALIVIDADDGEVLRFDDPEARTDLAPATIHGQTQLVAIGSPLGTNVLDVIDLRDGSRHHLADPARDSLFTIDTVMASPDGSRVGGWDFRADGENPTVIVSVDDGERVELPGFLAGLTDDRAITSEAASETSELTLRWFDQAGEETWRANLEPPDVAAAMPDGSVVYAVDGAFHRLGEGSETPEVLDGPDLAADDGRLILMSVGSGGRMLLLTSEEVLLLDDDAQTLASGPIPDPWVFDRSRATERCLVLGHMTRHGLAFDLERGEALTDGTVELFAQSPGDGCTLVTGEVGDDEAEYTVLGADVSHVTEPDLRVSGVSSAGEIVAMTRDGVFLLPTDNDGERIQVYDKPVWHQFVALDR